MQIKILGAMFVLPVVRRQIVKTGPYITNVMDVKVHVNEIT